MLKRISKNIEEHPAFFIGYLAFLSILIMLLAMYSKTESLIIVNHSWSHYQDVFFKYCTHLGDGWFAISMVLLLLVYRIQYGVIGVICFLRHPGGSRGYWMLRTALTRFAGQDPLVLLTTFRLHLVAHVQRRLKGGTNRGEPS